MDNFLSFGLPENILQAISRMQFTTPTPVQAQAIPPALEGQDIMATAQTGTGKTAAFSIPLICKLMEDPQAGAIILAPTRELAGQIADMIKQLAPSPDLKIALLIGGEAMPHQLKQLKRAPQIIVGTPGRVNDHLKRGTLHLNNARFLVLDETDRMLDMGFGVQIEKILEHMPEERQTLLFSATLPQNILKLAQKYLRDPVRIAVGTANAPTAQVKQDTLFIPDDKKYDELLNQLNAREGAIIIFVKTKYGADRLALKLNKEGHRAEAIHGNLRQRQRERVIGHFRNEKYRILVATDVAARGLDIPHIEHVINYDLPQLPEDYIHRIGRTGRGGAEGHAVSFITPADKIKWRAIQRFIDPKAVANDHTDDRPEKSGGNFRKGKKPFGKKSFDKKPFGKKRFDKSDKPRRDGRSAEGHGEKKGGYGRPARDTFKPRDHHNENRKERFGDERAETRGEKRWDKRDEKRGEKRFEKWGEKRDEKRGEKRRAFQDDSKGNFRKEKRDGFRSDSRDDVRDNARADTRKPFSKKRRFGERDEQRGEKWGEKRGEARGDFRKGKREGRPNDARNENWSEKRGEGRGDSWGKNRGEFGKKFGKEFDSDQRSEHRKGPRGKTFAKKGFGKKDFGSKDKGSPGSYRGNATPSKKSGAKKFKRFG